MYTARDQREFVESLKLGNQALKVLQEGMDIESVQAILDEKAVRSSCTFVMCLSALAAFVFVFVFVAAVFLQHRYLFFLFSLHSLVHEMPRANMWRQIVF